MTRLDRLVGWALLSGSFMLPGCVHLFRRSEPPRVILQAHQKAAVPESPYHSLPRAEVVSKPARPKRDVLERVNYPEPPPRPEPMPPRRQATSARLLPPIEEPDQPPTPAPPPEPTKMPEPASPPEEAALAALRCYLESKNEDAARLLDSYDRPTRDALLCLLPLAARYSKGRTVGPGTEDVPELVERLHGVIEPLRPKEPLRIDRLEFCRQIQHFGVYEPLTERRPVFHAGCDGQPGGMMLVYAEVRNFASEQRGPNHVTVLTSRAEIRTRDGRKMWSHPFGENEDKSRTIRRDYFITYTFCVPCGLAPGDYTLWIEVEDTLSKPVRTARRSVEFSVVANGATAHGAQGKSGTRVTRGQVEDWDE